MEHLTSFWAGAMDHGDGLDLSAVADAAGGWNRLEAGGADALIAAGVPVERARWWMATPPRQTCGKVVTMADPRYPAQLRLMRQPPPVLLVDGDPGVLSLPAVAGSARARRPPTAARSPVSWVRAWRKRACWW
jgi:hypothetical protein